MKLSKKRRIIISTITITAIAVPISIFAVNNYLDTKAIEGENLLKPSPSGVINNQDYDKLEQYVPGSDILDETKGNRAGGAYSEQATERKYNTRDTIKSVITKDQGPEGLCWAYSTSTAIEYLLAKNGIQTEISPKIMDYRWTSAERAYKESGVRNAYYDTFGTLNPSGSRPLGTGAYLTDYRSMFSNPLTLVSESSFISIAKENDARLDQLGITNRFEELWTKNDYESVTSPFVDDWGYTYAVYNTKQSFNKINNPNIASYVVTDMKYLFYHSYGDPSSAKKDFIQDVKNRIKAYGAVVASMNTGHGDYQHSDECTYVNPYGDIVFIDKTYDICKGGHAVALIGWDDDFVYEDNGVEKTGAFIVQNSWRTWDDKGWKFYLGYNSAFDILSYTGIEKYSEHDNHYSLVDYQPRTATPASNERIFEFKSSKKEKLDSFTLNEFDYSRKYDVMISSSATGNTYQKVSTTPFSTHMGFNKYQFSGDITVEGDYKIKLVKVDGENINNDYRKYEQMIVFTDNIGYKLTFDANGGSGTVATQTCEVGSSGNCQVTVPSTTPTRDGYTFLGWAESNTATSAAIRAGDKVTLSANKTVYAVWEKQKTYYKLSFDVNGGSGTVAVQTCEVTSGNNCQVTIPSTVPTRNSYSFLGWAESNTATSSTAGGGDKITLSGDKTLYAVWTPIHDTITDNAFLTCIRTAYKHENGSEISVPISNTDLARIENLGQYEEGGQTKYPCGNKSIHNLAGIELLTGVNFLQITGNSISEVDLSNNKALQKLYANNMVDGGDASSTGVLSSITLPSGSSLKEIMSRKNVLTSLDVSSNTGLDWVDVRDNMIASINGLDNNLDLTALAATNNRLSTLDISKNESLLTLKIQGNPLDILDISNNKKLSNLQLDADDLVYTGVAPIYHPSNGSFVYDFSDFDFINGQISISGDNLTFDESKQTISVNKNGLQYAQVGMKNRDSNGDIIDNHYMLELYGGAKHGSAATHASGAMLVPHPNYQGASDNIQTIVCNLIDNSSCTVTLPTITRDDYTLLGWADNANATTPKYRAGDDISLDGYKEVYAVWKSNQGDDTTPDSDISPDTNPNSDSEPDLPIPNTAADTSEDSDSDTLPIPNTSAGVSTPDTGKSTKNSSGLSPIILFGSPILLVAIFVGKNIWQKKQSHRKFD